MGPTLYGLCTGIIHSPAHQRHDQTQQNQENPVLSKLLGNIFLDAFSTVCGGKSEPEKKRVNIDEAVLASAVLRSDYNKDLFGGVMGFMLKDW